MDKLHIVVFRNQTVDGHDRNVVVKLQQGSSYPGEDFLRGIEDDVRATVGGFGLASDALTVAPEQEQPDGDIGPRLSNLPRIFRKS